MQGNTIENHYGNGIRCQGPQVSFSPFITSSFNQKRPQDYIYETPVYDQSVDENGNLINPGDILYYQENYSGNKDSLGLNFGAALTFTFPLDNRFQDACLKSATTQEKIQQQILQRLYEHQTIILGTHIQLQDQVLNMMDRLYLLQTQLSLKL